MRNFLISAFGALLLLMPARSAVYAAADRANILLIVADDLGYSDLGIYGSEIDTPALNALATEGILLSQFHVAPNCGPTRAAMLTGVDYHRAGIGGNVEVSADNQKGLPAYQGFLRDDVVAVSELLRDAGYNTYMAGKWHLGKNPRNLPGGRGFDRSFALLNGGASHWSDQATLVPGSKTTYTQDDKVVKILPKDFYSSTYYADRIINYIDDGLADGKPFFAYLAFTAPHNPLHAPDASIAKYRGVYDQGWDALAKERLARMKKLGLVGNAVFPAARPDWILAWDELTERQQAERARDREIYAGMIDYLDHSVGRVLDHLRAKGEYENTLIIFISDNGPAKTTIIDYLELGGEAADFVNSFDNSLGNRGRPGSSTDIGPGWAFASASPLRLFKGYLAQGGIQVPAIFKLPGSIKQATRTVAIPTHVTDLAPTFLEIAGVAYPRSYRGHTLPEHQGRSLLPMLSRGDTTALKDRGFGWEAYGMDGWRQGNWKMVRLPPPYGNGEWQLYDLRKDPAETMDLAMKMPDQVRGFAAEWTAYAKKNEVVHPDKPVAYAKPPAPGKY
jgi:arylsulfatase A-like enzyme